MKKNLERIFAMNKSPMIKNYQIVKSITPSLRYKEGEDFTTWRKTAQEKLYNLLGMDKFEKCDPMFNIEHTRVEEAYTEYRFTMVLR